MMKSGLIHILSAAVAVLMLFGCFSAMGESAELFEYRIQDNGSILITGYRGTDTELVIPETIDGLPVNGISGSFGFNTPSIKNLTCIELPKTMISIESGALEFAEYLAEIRVDPEHPVFSFSDGVLYNREKQSMYSTCRRIQQNTSMCRKEFVNWRIRLSFVPDFGLFYCLKVWNASAVNASIRVLCWLKPIWEKD